MAIVKKEKDNPKLSQEMQDLLSKTHGDGDGIAYDDTDRYKYLIMKVLTSDQDILRALHNGELEKTNTDKLGKINGDAYRDVSIFNFLKIPGIRSTVKNFICFEVDDIETARYNENLIIKNIIFRTISHDEDYQTDWGIARQDLLAAIIKSKFDWSNMFGMHLVKVYDKGKTAEDGYYYREFIYQTTVPNNLANKSRNGGVGYNG